MSDWSQMRAEDFDAAEPLSLFDAAPLRAARALPTTPDKAGTLDLFAEAAEHARLAAEGDWCPVCKAYTDSYQNDDCVVCARPRTTPTRTA